MAYLPLTEEQDDLVMYWSQSLAHYARSFWKEKERKVERYFFFNFKEVLKTNFFHSGSSYPTYLACKVSRRYYFSPRRNPCFCCHYTNIDLVSSSLGRPQCGLHTTYWSKRRRFACVFNVFLNWPSFQMPTYLIRSERSLNIRNFVCLRIYM